MAFAVFVTRKSLDHISNMKGKYQKVTENTSQRNRFLNIRERLALNQRKYISSDVRKGALILKLVYLKRASRSSLCLRVSNLFYEETPHAPQKNCLKRSQEF